MKKPFNERPLLSAFFLLFIICGAMSSANAKTRWSSLHLIPDADFLSGGQFVLDAEGYTFGDSSKGQIVRPAALINFGIMEWVNLDVGYAGGLTLGFKARLLGETSEYMPSLAIGARNIVSNREANFFNSKDTMDNEFYFALAKSVDPIRLRIHAGMQTIPTSKSDQVDPFFALEEYCGTGLYVTFEIERLRGAFWPSLFASWRILNRRLEFSAGAVAINRLFFDKNNKFNVSLTSTDGFVRPGIWFGIRYRGFVPLSKSKVFSSIDDNIKTQGENIDQLKKEIDSLKISLSENLTRLAKVDNSIIMLSDSIYSDRNRLKAALFDKLVALKILYESEPFEPEQVRQSINRIVAIKENALPILKEFIIDKKQDRKIRMIGISLVGEMGGTGASDALLDVLSQSEDPDIKIEILIALGKMKETRALYVMEQLANDPIDVVAFTAQEVLHKLVKEKGIQLSPDFKMRPVAMSDSSVIRDEKIPIKKTAKGMEVARPPEKTKETKPSSNNAAASGEAAKTNQLPAASGNPSSDTLKAKSAPQTAKKDTSDVWGVHARGADSSKTGAIVKGDSAAGKTTLQAKKDEKAQPPLEKKKDKASKNKKKAPSSSTAEDKNW